VIKTDLSTTPPSYSGEVLVNLDVTTDITSLVFNLHPSLIVTHLAISSSDLKTMSSLVLPLSQLSVDEKQERATVDLSSLPGGGLRAGGKGVKLFVRFEAELGVSMAGYYKSEGDPDETTGKKPV
jgi:aminopeptidase 2